MDVVAAKTRRIESPNRVPHMVGLFPGISSYFKISIKVGRSELLVGPLYRVRIFSLATPFPGSSFAF